MVEHRPCNAAEEEGGDLTSNLTHLPRLDPSHLVRVDRSLEVDGREKDFQGAVGHVRLEPLLENHAEAVLCDRLEPFPNLLALDDDAVFPRPRPGAHLADAEDDLVAPER